jgi:hypothetical protein
VTGSSYVLTGALRATHRLVTGLVERELRREDPGSRDADTLSLLASWNATGNAENTTLKQA